MMEQPSLTPLDKIIVGVNNTALQADNVDTSIWPTWLFGRKPGETISPTWLEALSLLFIIIGSYACGAATAMTIKTLYRLRRQRQMKKARKKESATSYRLNSPVVIEKAPVLKPPSKPPPPSPPASMPTVAEPPHSSRDLPVVQISPFASFQRRQYKRMIANNNNENNLISANNNNSNSNNRHSVYTTSPIVWERRQEVLTPKLAITSNSPQRTTWCGYYATVPTADNIYQNQANVAQPTTPSTIIKSGSKGPKRNKIEVLLSASYENNTKYGKPLGVWERRGVFNSRKNPHGSSCESVFCDQV